MTLDHWRMRAYDLEANWSRCSRACADEQTKRIKAEARAERLKEALADIGDADRELGDDLAWCERRAAEPLPMIRALLRDHEQEVGDGR